MTYLRILAILTALGTFCTPATADQASEAARIFLLRAFPVAGSDIEIAVQETTSIKLAPCAQTSAKLAPGQNWVGSTAVNVRCDLGADWLVMVPATVKLFGQVVLANKNLAAGSTIKAGDIKLVRQDISALSGEAITELALALDRSLIVAIPAGAPLRLEQFKPETAVRAGQTVRIRFIGNGFQVEGQGRAKQNGFIGDSIGVQTGKDQTVQAIVIAPGTVSVDGP